jgi:hypothetical protein
MQSTPMDEATMSDHPNQLDHAQAHRYFAAHCFNETWTLIDKVGRSADDNRMMVATCYASIWHWGQRPECTAKNLSIGYWQLSRVYALIGDGSAAADAGRVCLAHSRDLEPFYLGYAHEALARAAATRGDDAMRADHLGAARAQAEAVADPEWRLMLEKDLDTI